MEEVAKNLLVVLQDAYAHGWWDRVGPNLLFEGMVSVSSDLREIAGRFRQNPELTEREVVLWVAEHVDRNYLHLLEVFCRDFPSVPLVVLAEGYSQATMAYLFRQGVWELMRPSMMVLEELQDTLDEALERESSFEDVIPASAISAVLSADSMTMQRTPVMQGRMFRDKWRLLNLIDKGGMGLVYEARDEETREMVAVKLVHPTLARDTKVRERFLREAFILNTVDHFAIPAMYDYGVDPVTECPYVVMQLLQGKNLRTLLPRDQGLELWDALYVVSHVMQALNALHENKVVHRDLKPDNVFLHTLDVSHYQPFLLDFGVSRVLDLQTLFYTEPGMTCGTPQYMAPEQLFAGEIDYRADYYALGVLLFELVTGTLPQTVPPQSPLPAGAENSRWSARLASMETEAQNDLTHMLCGLTQLEADDRPKTLEPSLIVLQRVLEKLSPASLLC